MNIQIGQHIRSFDFPGNIEHFMEGVVEKVENDLIHMSTTKIVAGGKEIGRTPATMRFKTPTIGNSMVDDMFPNFKRLVVID